MADDQEVGRSRLRRLRGRETPAAEEADDAVAPTAVPVDAAANEVAGRPTTGDGRRGRRSLLRTLLVLAVALALGLVAGGVSAFAVSKTTPTYQSQALLEIDQPRAIAASGDDGVVAKLGRLRFKYAGLVRTQVFSGPVSQQLGVPQGAVGSALFALADQQSLLLAVGARTHSADRARLIAQAASQYLTSYVRDEQTRDGIPEAQQITFSIATPAGAAHQIAPTRRREVLVALFAFLFVAGAVSGLALAGRRDT